MKAVAYFRVSTAAQGRSGLGIDAQKHAVAEIASVRGLEILAQFTEVESGRRDDRPQLSEALQYARLTGSVLVIAKLDRLSRNAAFLLALRDSGVRFLAADIPDANDLTIGVLAVIAQAEREAISKRTKEALASVNRRIEHFGEHVSRRTGTSIRRLGNPNGSESLKRAAKGNGSAIEAAKSLADGRSERLAPLLQQLRKSGSDSFYSLAKALNDRGVLTPRGGRWHASSVRNICLRIR